MTSERGLWHTVTRRLSPYGRLQRIETTTATGVADVAYCLLGSAGWLELKELDSWPKRLTTAITIPSLTREQVMFLEGWAAAGGAAHLLLQVERSYLLLNPPAARSAFERALTRGAIESAATVWATGAFPVTAVLKALTGRG